MPHTRPDLEVLTARILGALRHLGGATFGDLQLDLKATTLTWTKRALEMLLEEGRVTTTTADEELTRDFPLAKGKGTMPRKYRAKIYPVAKGKRARRRP